MLRGFEEIDKLIFPLKNKKNNGFLIFSDDAKEK